MPIQGQTQNQAGPLNPQMVGTVGQVQNVAATLFALEVDGANPRDKVTSEVIMTSGYFTGDLGILTGSTTAGSQIHSASLDSANQIYYQQIADKVDTDATATAQLSVAYGNFVGGGSKESYADKGSDGASEYIYKQWASILLPENEVTGAFFISSPASDPAVASGYDGGIYVVSAHRSLMGDAIDPGNWTFNFTGSKTNGNGSELTLTDDSVNKTPEVTIVGKRYNIVSGSGGTVVSASTARNFGFFYSDIGVWIMSAAELSASIPGDKVSTAAVVYDSGSQQGFGIYGSTTVDENNALRLINCLRGSGSEEAGGQLTIRDMNVEQSVSYFCRAYAPYANFSNNPTFCSSSANKIRHEAMLGNPQVYISHIGLYNRSGQIMAVANLSKPILKNFSTEATIKVKLTF